LAVGLIAAIILVVFTNCFAQTSAGHWLDTRAFEVLQHQLVTFKDDENLPILVVDISKVPGGKDSITSRKTLLEIITAIIKQKPKAIAVDIDFSPTEAGWKADDDPEFFDACLSLKQEANTPIFLAVFHTRAEPANGWLGVDKYKELAAAAIVMDKDARRMPRWVQGGQVADKLPSLSFALAAAYEPSSTKPLSFPWNWVLETSSDNQHGIEIIRDNLRVALTLVNYSREEDIRKEAVGTVSATSISEVGDRFSGKMILLGDAQVNDSFSPSGYKVTPGVYVLASSAYTLAVAPLYELRPRARLILDLIISFIVVTSIELLRRRYVKKREGPRFWERQSLFIFIAIAAFILGCIFAVVWLGVMWMDFTLIVFAIFLHPSVEKSINKMIKKFIPAKRRARQEVPS
jgi:CHASE2 domain-containing sensor protein